MLPAMATQEQGRPDESLDLLEQWQSEHERNELELVQLAKQKSLLLQALQDKTVAVQNLQEEVASIKKRSLASAGSAMLQLQLIAREEQEGRLLGSEVECLTVQLEDTLMALHNKREAAAKAALVQAKALPARHVDHRKRCAENIACARRLKTHLRVLEAELGTPE